MLEHDKKVKGTLVSRLRAASSSLSRAAASADSPRLPPPPFPLPPSALPSPPELSNPAGLGQALVPPRALSAPEAEPSLSSLLLPHAPACAARAPEGVWRPTAVAGASMAQLASSSPCGDSQECPVESYPDRNLHQRAASTCESQALAGALPSLRAMPLVQMWGASACDMPC